MIKTLPLKRQIKSKVEYVDWLKSLKQGDLCFVQEFHPKNKSLLEIDYEFWVYSVVRIAKIEENTIVTTGHIFSSQNYNHSFTDGVLTYIDSPEYFDLGCFYSRLVGLTSELLPKDFTKESDEEYKFDWIAANLPIYEPQFEGERVFLLQPFKGQRQSQGEKKLITSSFPNYSYKVNNGNIIVCFPGQKLAFEFEDWLKENNISLLRYLYAESLYI